MATATGVSGTNAVQVLEWEAKGRDGSLSPSFPKRGWSSRDFSARLQDVEQVILLTVRRCTERQLHIRAPLFIVGVPEEKSGHLGQQVHVKARPLQHCNVLFDRHEDFGQFLRMSLIRCLSRHISQIV